MSEENPNVLTNIMPKILARGLMVLRQQCVMPRLVNSDYNLEARLKGATIDVPVPVEVDTIDVDPNRLPVAKAITTPGVVSIALDNWKQNAPIGLSDKDLCEIDENTHFLPMQLMEAVKALATDVNVEIFSHYCGASRGVYGVAGELDGFGTTPFDSLYQGVKGATEARKVLNEQLCPKGDRRGVVDWACEANMLALPAFSDAEKIMSAVVKMEGEIGRKFAIDWVADDDVPTHTPGTMGDAAGVLIARGTAGNAYVEIEAQGGHEETIKVGDILTFADDSQTYVVIGRTATSEYDSTTKTYTFESDDPDYVTIGIAPVLETSPAGTVTPYAAHVVNMAFHRDAFAFATRPLLDVSRQYSLGSQMVSMQDPVSGLILRLEVSRQHKQTVWEFDILWGSDLVRADLATRIVGDPS